jgi:uncharacterized delta-60 repeat protein
LPSGATDASFGSEGLASFGMSTSAHRAFDLAVDAHGRAVVVGYTGDGDDMIVVRFTSSGTPDLTFNRVNGTGTPYFQVRSSGYAAAYGMAIQPDGKILLTGVDPEGAGLPVFRVVPGEVDTGPAALDTRFGGGDGVAVVTGLHPYGAGLSLQPDGGIIVIGMCRGADRRCVGAVLRLTPDGAVDGGYGSPSGVHIRVPNGTDGLLTAVQALPSGGLAVAGLADITGTYRPFVATLDPPGGDTAPMAPHGARLLGPSDTDAAALAVHPEGHVVVAGTTRTGPAGSSGVVYRLPAGHLPTA